VKRTKVLYASTYGNETYRQIPIEGIDGEGGMGYLNTPIKLKRCTQ